MPNQGHLTRFLSFGLGLSVTAIEADPTLVTMASKFDGQLVWALEKEKQKKVSDFLILLHTYKFLNKVWISENSKCPVRLIEYLSILCNALPLTLPY